ncbi:DUF3168 domain-containing protein [uncultured Amaricoccus sp.]|uniref:DUF3168 domain-containing protein n=1 Tax=uncultured Amaricoccus sp. TaxID=339341 RepID=UPI0026055A40|nr:DUF3168 domain-containing protein [uncultured Amaricoccus sp.]
MTYRYSAGLQAAIYQRLAADAALGNLVGGAIYDAPLQGREGAAAPDHITLGDEATRPFDTKTSVGAIHDFSVKVHSARDGFDTAKRIAGAVCAALMDAPLTLADGRLVSMRFLRAKAERGAAPEKRRISLLFRAVVDESN